LPDEPRLSSLCRPDDQKSCFACCPPIRPPDYDHADYQKILTRHFWENTRLYQKEGPGPRVITGYSCWGLGMLDRSGRLIGCMLHPAQNQGRDLRDLTGYGDKCRRELCPEAELFTRLPPASAGLVLGLASGLDSFAYSSRKLNPTFLMLRWGETIIGRLAQSEPGGLSRPEFQEKYPFLARELSPEKHAFPLELALAGTSLERFNTPETLNACILALDRFVARHRSVAGRPLDNRPYLHQLEISVTFRLFLRYALNWVRADYGEALAVREALAGVIAELKIG